MNHENLNNKYTIKIIAAKNDDMYKGYELFECPVNEFGGTLMRVIKDRVAERLIVLNEKEGKSIKD